MAPKGRDVAAAERRPRAVRLRIEGLSFAQIGERLGVSDEQARKDVKRATAEFNRETQENAAEYVALEWERLEMAADAIRPQVLAGQLPAVDQWRKLSESRRKLRGLDAPDRKELSGPNGSAVVQIVEEVVSGRSTPAAAAPENPTPPGAEVVPVQ